MLTLDIVALKVSITERNKRGEDFADVLIFKDGVLGRYNITRCKHEALGKEHDPDWRDTKIETHIKNAEFEKDLKELIKVHFEDEIKGGDKGGN